MTDEKELIFKRFPKEKQDQVRGLVEYATLMGLSGKDLVSIGGKLDRLKKIEQKENNLATISGFECLPIGKDPATPEKFDERFKLKGVTGAYNFETNGDGYWRVYSAATKKSKTHYTLTAGDYELGSVRWHRRCRYAILLDIANGKLLLNF